MLIKERTWTHIETAIKEHLLSEQGENSHIYGTITVLDMVFDKKVYETITKKLDPSNIPKTHRQSAKRAIQVLRKKLPETREFLLNPPQWLRDIVFLHFLYKIDQDVEYETMLQAHFDELLDKVPLIVDEPLVYYKDKTFYGVILYPSAREKEKLRIRSYMGLFRQFLDDLLGKVIQFEPDRYSVKIYGYRVSFPKHVYYEILKKFYKYDMIVDLLRKDIGEEVLSELEKLGKVEVQSDSISVEVDPAKLGLDSEVEKLQLYFTVKPEKEKEKEARVYVWSKHGQFTIRKPYHCFPECKKELPEVFEYNSYSELPGLAKIMLERTKHLFMETLSLRRRLEQIAAKHGFAVVNVSYPAMYTDTTVFYFGKDVEGFHATVVATIDYNTGSMSLEYIVSKKLKRQSPELVKHIESVLLDKHRVLSNSSGRTLEFR